MNEANIRFRYKHTAHTVRYIWENLIYYFVWHIQLRMAMFTHRSLASISHRVEHRNEHRFKENQSRYNLADKMRQREMECKRMLWISIKNVTIWRSQANAPIHTRSTFILHFLKYAQWALLESQRKHIAVRTWTKLNNKIPLICVFGFIKDRPKSKPKEPIRIISGINSIF